MSHSEPDYAVSFSDQRRSPNREMPHREVAINGQTPRGCSLDWLNDLQSYFPDVAGELKSTELVRKFKNLPGELQKRVKVGLRRVRIHIVDTLAYQARENVVYRKTLRQDPKFKFLLERARNGNEEAKKLLRHLEGRVAQDILWDSPSARLERLMEFSSDYAGFGYRRFLPKKKSKNDLPDLTQFDKPNASYERTVAKYAAQEAAVFSDALEGAKKAIFFGNTEAENRVAEILSRSHAFDEGDQKRLI